MYKNIYLNIHNNYDIEIKNSLWVSLKYVII